MENKYKGLKNKSPKEVIEILGKVEKYNYLAHSIREIELAILRIKSEEHKSDIERRKHIYEVDDLKKMLSATIKSKKPEIYDDIVKSLNLPKF